MMGLNPDKCISCFYIWIVLFLAFGSSFAGGSIDVLPLGFMGDATTPYAIHFTWDSSAFTGLSTISTKIRMNSGTSNANNMTWSITPIAGWRSDSIGFSTLQPINVTNSTASGWLFGRSTSKSYFGISTCSIRARKANSGTNYDLIEPVSIYSWNSTTQAGWLEGTFSSFTNTIILAMDSSSNILGSYITEPNGINEGYSNQPGYFKVAVPIGSIYRVELRDLNNQYILNKFGPWTITANTVTTIPEPAEVPIFYWSFY